ncbi:MAG: ABC transporter permease [Gammaproteobacteria bacterium]|nr:ABC transporter permease [Gammaproteobacteria bacterium]
MPLDSPLLQHLARRSETVAIPLMALAAGFSLFALFLLLQEQSPLDYFTLVYKAGFGTAFSWQNTLTRASPLILAALCVALPARLGLIVIGGEGAIVLGGVAASAFATFFPGNTGLVGLLLMGASAAAMGALWIGLIGLMRYGRGVNETISSLLMAYIGVALMNHLVEGPLRDPNSLNKPATYPLSAEQRLGNLPGLDIHWGLVIGIISCFLVWILMTYTRWGFSARVAGGNVRAAQVQGLPVGILIVGFTALGGAFAGLAGMVEVAAVHGTANASLASGYGYTGILVAFLARHNPLVIIPVAILLGGFEAANGLVQRRMDLPDATVLVLQGFVFITILISETLYGRIHLFNPERWKTTPTTIREKP